MSNIEQLFDSFIKRISITDEEDKKAKKWTREIKEGIEGKDKDFMDFIFLSGSCKRETAISPLHDIDLYIVIKNDLPSGDYLPSKLRNFYQPIVNSISDTIKMPTQFKYGLKTNVAGLDVDIIITKYHRKSDKLFEIVSNENWIITSPIFHERRLKDKNIKTSGMAHNFIKIMKYWNIKKNKQLSSFHLEALVLDEIPTKVEKYSIGISSLFGNMAKALQIKKKSPIKEAPHIDNLTPNERSEAIRLLKLSAQQANRKDWMSIFGKGFYEDVKIVHKTNRKKKNKKKYTIGMEGDDPYMYLRDD